MTFSRFVIGVRPGILTGFALLACAPARSPLPEPLPLPIAVDTAATPATFSYASGQHAYALESRATIQIAGDTSLVSDTLASTTYLTYRIEGDEAVRRLVGTVDSFVVAPAARVPSSPAPLLAPIPFGGTVTAGTVSVEVPEEAVSNCGSPAGALLATAAELLPALPGRLVLDARLEEMASSTVCRGGVTMTTTATHRYRVAGDTVTPDGEGVLIERRSSYSVAGGGTQGDQMVATQGDGSGSGELVVDATGGRLLGGVSRSILSLTFTTAGQTQQVTQHAEQRLRLVNQ